MAGTVFVWTMTDGRFTRTFILHNRLITTVMADRQSGDTAVKVNHYSKPESARAFMLHLTAESEKDGLALRGLWALPMVEGSTVHDGLRTLFHRHIKDATHALPVVAAVAREVMTHGESLS